MELKQGYKQSEFGFIPDEWDVSTISDCTESNGLIRGPFGGALKKEFFVPSGYKVYEQKNAIYKSIELGQYYIDKEKFVELSRFQIKANDFIVSCSGTIGRIYLIPKQYKEGVINQALLIIRINSSKCSRAYFEHCFSSDWFQTKITDSTQGGAMKNMVGMSEFKMSTIPLPPLSEQTAIANALSDMDALISQTEKLIEKKKAIKQGAMQELLKPKEGWVTKKLGDVCEVFGRIGFRGYTVEDIVPEHQGAISLSPSNIIDGKLSLHKATYISWDKYYESPEIMVNEGDIILVKTASIGKNCVITKLDSKATVNPQIVVLKNFKMDNLLLGYIISSPIVQNQIKTKMVGGVLATLSQEEIKNFKIEVPKRHEDQQRISNLLFDLDETINLMEKKLSKLKLQKQGMMQALLTGKIRLVS